MDREHQEKAVNAYLKFLQGKQVSADAIEMRAKFVRNLGILLVGQTGREGYKRALEKLLKIENRINHNQQLNIAREFYPFWIDDVKLIAVMAESYGYDLSATRFTPMPDPLEWADIEALHNTQEFDERENDLLNQYTEELKVQKLSKKVIEAKVKLVKIVLMRLRDIPIKNNLAYRMAVEVTLPLFHLDEIRQRFLQAIREFFYIWIGKPNAT